MNQPQELEVWYLIPTIRKELSLSLKKLGLKQKEIAKKLEISEPAVSQYIKEKRANQLTLPDSIKKLIDISAKKILENKANLIEEIKNICDQSKKERLLCNIHKKEGFDTKNCNICMR